MTLKTTAAVLAALTFLTTPIAAQAQNTTTQTTPTLVAVDLVALKAKCISNRAFDCEDATVAALNAYLLQGGTPAQINAQIGLIAAMLITAYNANTDLHRIRFSILAIADYSSDQTQIDALFDINLLMLDRLPVTLNANASALSPS